jgi:predicted nucleic acid-binding protein
VKLLDTNVFIYARGRDHPYRSACRAILETALVDPAAFNIDVETTQELMDVYTRRGERTRAARTVTDLFSLFPDPFAITRAETEEAARLLGKHGGLSPRDAIHAAVALGRGLEGIVSTDRAFDRITGLRRFDPANIGDG